MSRLPVFTSLRGSQRAFVAEDLVGLAVTAARPDPKDPRPGP
jgi:hypothetical protein